MKELECFVLLWGSSSTCMCANGFGLQLCFNEFFSLALLIKLCSSSLSYYIYSFFIDHCFVIISEGSFVISKYTVFVMLIFYLTSKVARFYNLTHPLAKVVFCGKHNFKCTYLNPKQSYFENYFT